MSMIVCLCERGSEIERDLQAGRQTGKQAQSCRQTEKVREERRVLLVHVPRRAVVLQS